MSNLRLLVGGLAVAVVLGLAPPVAAGLPEILPLAKVVPGMTGYGLTVFSGTKVERFPIRVLSVMRQFLPKQDVVLVMVEDERVKKSGVAAGMSGSPIYIDGKLMGALAYAWSFAKEPLAGITPIEAMIADSRRPARPEPGAQAAAGAVTSLGGGAGPAHDRSAGWGEARLVPVAAALSLSGLSEQHVRDLRDELAPFGMLPVNAPGGAAGGGAGAKGPPVRGGTLAPGDAVGVELIRGDMSAVATGTVTYVDGKTVLAFGHPMMGAGQVNLPMVGAEIHTIMPSLASAFKIASPLAELGALIGDRSSCVVGTLGGRASRVPVTVSVGRAKGAVPVPFRAEIARNDRLTPLLVSMVASSALSIAEADPVDVFVELTTRIVLRGVEPLELREQVYSPTGFSPRVLGAGLGFRALGQLVNNGFQPVDLDRLDITARLAFRRDVVSVVSARVAARPVREGKTIEVEVTLRPFGGGDWKKTIPIAIPAGMAGKVLDLEIASGSLVRPFHPRAESLRDLLSELRDGFPASSLVVSLSLPRTGAAVRGAIIAGLPPAALDTLSPAHASRRAETHRLFERTVVPLETLVSGKIELKIAVEDEPLGRVN